MVLMTVAVPEGLSSGDQMTVSADGQEFTVFVPEGCRAGDEVSVDLPVVEQSPGADCTMERVQVEIPVGVTVGEAFDVVAAWGGTFTVAVPEDCAAGDVIEIELPAAPASETGGDAVAAGGGGSSADPAAASVRDASAAGSHEWASGPMHPVGKHVSVLRTNGSYSPGVVVDYDGVSGTYTVELPGGLLKYLVEEVSARSRREARGGSLARRSRRRC